jgi:hypothetical protein
MRFSGVLASLMLSVLVCAASLLAQEANYTWSMSGELSGTADSNIVYVAVTSDAALTAATVEVHFDTTKLEFVPYTDGLNYLTGRTTVFEQAPVVNNNGSHVRTVLFDFNQNLPVGSGNVLKFNFKVKDGVTGGTKTLITLTTRKAAAVLATQQFEVQGIIWDNPGDPKTFGWNINGVAVADSNATEVYIGVNNSLWVADMILDLEFDPAILAIANPATDVTLKGRATDVNLAVAHTAGSGAARLTFSTTSSIPPFPVIDAGTGKILGIKLQVVGSLAAGASTELKLKLGDGTLLSSYQLQARAYSGPSADVDGNGSTSIFDLLEFLKLWSNAPPSVFTDVNGDGKSDIFDLLAILSAMKG